MYETFLGVFRIIRWNGLLVIYLYYRLSVLNAGPRQSAFARLHSAEGPSEGTVATLNLPTPKIRNCNDILAEVPLVSIG